MRLRNLGEWMAWPLSLKSSWTYSCVFFLLLNKMNVRLVLTLIGIS